LKYFAFVGFKWIGNKALQLKAENYEILFSYEEALGYCVGDIVADKDGICLRYVSLLYLKLRMI
jgi:phosphomannomutase